MRRNIIPEAWIPYLQDLPGVFLALALLIAAVLIARATWNHWKVYKDYTTSQSFVSFSIAGALSAMGLVVLAVSVLT